MKTRLNLCAISFFTICLLFCTVKAQVSLTPDTVITFLKTSTAPEIDGVLDPIWQNVTEFAIGNSVPLHTDETDPSDENDYSGTFRAIWDENYFYCFFDIVDDTLMRDDDIDKIYHDDCIELYFDGDNSKGTEYDEIDDWQIQIAYDDPTTSFRIGPKSPNADLDISEFATVAVLINDVGWTLEIAVLWGALNMAPVDNQAIGIEYDYDDDDDGGDNEHKIKAFANAIDDTWKNPSLMGTAILSSELIPTSIEHEIHNYPDKLYLCQNFPNPFNPTTEIVYWIPNMSNVTLEVYNLLGEKMITLINSEIQKAGSHEVTFDGSRLDSGLYLYRLQIDSEVVSRKMMLTK